MGKTSKKVSFSKTKTSVVTLGGKNIAQVKKLTFYLQFFYYNPYNTSSDKWRPLPDGLDVIMYDYDTLSPNDELGKAKTTGDGTPICLQVDDKDENKPDIFFIIKTNKKFINLDTEKLVDSVENPSTFPYIRLPETIDSRSKKATDKQKGYLRNYSGKGEGKNEKGKEWTFKLEDIQMFIQLQYYRESGDTSEFMPEGLKVSGYDEDSFLSPDDLQATGCIGENGKVYLPIFNKDEQKPELYFTILNNENICLDKDKKKYIKGGTPNGKEIIALPQKWLSKDRMDDDNKKGIKKSHSLSTVGTMTDPWKFHYIRGLKIDYIQKESKIHSFWDTKLEGSPVVTSAVFTVKTVPTNSDVELQGTVVDESGNEVKKLSLSKITTGKYELKWDGTDSSNDKIKPGKYKIQLRGTLDTLVKAVSDEIKVVRVGVTGIEFQDSYPLKLYDDISTFFSWKKVDFDIPAIQWKIKDLDDSDKPRKEPALSASEESSDTDNYSYPVCYKMGSKLKVKLTLGGKDYAAGDDIRVQLIDSTKFDSSDNEKIAAGGNTTFTAKAGNELPAKIFRTDNYKLDFHFAYKDASGAWHNMGAQKTKNHRVYTILGDPVEPWGDGSSSSKVRPWITVLDKLCNDWVKNETTKDDTAKKIVEEVFHSGITYDTKDGASFYTSGGSPTTAPTHAELKKWLNVIAGKSRSVHNGKKVNCTDCGTMVCSLANAVGCELHSSKFYDTVTGASFNCHKIISIGSSTWDYPFSQYYGGIEGKFSYHEIAWKGSCGGSDKIFDACLKVADNPVTSPATNAKYAADMTFNTYKPKLVDPVSLANTNPNPLTKDRRKVR